MDELNEYEQYLAYATQELSRNGNKKICQTQDHPSAEILREFEDVLSSAKEEKPLQEFLTRHPEMLVQQLGAGCRWVIPKPQLGGKLEPDFMVGRIDSGGLRWVAIELESPAVESLFTKSNGTPGEKLRQGIQQVKDWRHWIENNLQTARNSPRSGGCGLFGVTPRIDGMVFIGRREVTREDDQRHRHEIAWDQRIQVHTYDWLLEEARKLLPLHRATVEDCEECDRYGR
ncbi:Shedu anti-phage system protein SduA domain-containing protein [Streptomyces sp. NRRL F-2747]|uniref:Shedu anti-phage system protein SduA domain-containing protein n=1 Tax=Streptomyces sp. NRRL F-2747 TaxID=1463843 RepID=UPI00099D85BA|nr:Shedu anti-phage system protein SduA domain-containing protein [Streptomyces sp. NRRL F-2747]